ncbi:MAG: hypothetical protein U5N86_04530 [Planctomycetota bacterium]|nr:hypothetical protein [Planctomycetota bacterium]
MKRYVYSALVALVFVFAFAGGVRAENPEVKLVKSKAKPGGKYAERKGVKQFYELCKNAEQDLDKAIEALQSYIKANTDQPVAVYYLAAAMLEKDDKEKAAEYIELGDKTSPGEAVCVRSGTDRHAGHP